MSVFTRERWKAEVRKQRKAALDFARQHDWGARARLEGGMIVDLDDIYTTATGETVASTATVPATLEAVRAFGGY